MFIYINKTALAVEDISIQILILFNLLSNKISFSDESTLRENAMMNPAAQIH